jgi:hypothetical protein
MNSSAMGSPVGTNISEIINGSYTSLGTKVINGSTFTLVKFTDIISLNLNASAKPITQNENGTIYFNPTWNATLITILGYNFSGSLASTLGRELMIFFEIPFAYNSLSSSLNLLQQVMHQVNETTVTFGNVTLDVTNYNYNSSTSFDTTTSTTASNSDCGGTYNAPPVNATGYGMIQIGKLPNSSATIITNLDFFASAAGFTSSGSFQIDTLTLAPQVATTTSSTSMVTRTTSLSTI